LGAFSDILLRQYGIAPSQISPQWGETFKDQGSSIGKTSRDQHLSDIWQVKMVMFYGEKKT
jgi:hypothetical protein